MLLREKTREFKKKTVTGFYWWNFRFMWCELSKTKTGKSTQKWGYNLETVELYWFPRGRQCLWHRLAYSRRGLVGVCVLLCTFCVFWCGIIWVHSNLGAEVKSILCHPFSKTFQCNIIRFETRYFWRYFWICRIRRSFQGGWHLVGQQKILMEKPNIKCMILYCKINNNIKYLIQF